MLLLPNTRCSDAAQGYYQEAGRAGRDGKRSECILLYAARDIPRIVRLLRSGKGRSKAKFDRGFALLNQASLFRTAPYNACLCLRSAGQVSNVPALAVV